MGSPSKCVDPVLLLELATPETHWAETSQIEPMVDQVLLVALEIGSAVTADVAVEIASAVPEAVVAEDSVYSAVPAAAVAVVEIAIALTAAVVAAAGVAAAVVAAAPLADAPVPLEHVEVPQTASAVVILHQIRCRPHPPHIRTPSNLSRFQPFQKAFSPFLLR